MIREAKKKPLGLYSKIEKRKKEKKGECVVNYNVKSKKTQIEAPS